MNHPSRHHWNIYRSGGHIAITLLVIAIPFVFLFLFSRLAAVATGPLFLDVFVSLQRMVIAYILAVLVAWILAVGFYNGRRAAVALPLFDVLQSLPTFALLPLITYWHGASALTIIVFLIISIIWPIFFSITSSLKLIKHDWYEAIQMADLSGFNYIRYFILPVTIPGIITGSIVGLGDGWEALIATEIIVRAPTGLGEFFGHYSHNTTITLFGTLGFLLLIFSINKLIWLPLLEWSHKIMDE